MRTTRGPLTASSNAPADAVERARAARPKPRPAETFDPKNPLAGASRFVTTNGDRGLWLKVAFLPAGEDDADDERTAKCIEALQGTYVKFREGAFVTRSEAITEWLRGRLASRRLRGVEEDYQMVDIRCPHCEFTAKNTPAGQKAMGKHILDAHESKQEAA